MTGPVEAPGTGPQGAAEQWPVAEFPPSLIDPDTGARDQARRAVAALERDGSVGRLGELAASAAAVQGRCPPRRFGRIRVLSVAAGDAPDAVCTRLLAEAAGASLRPVAVGDGPVAAAFAAGRRVVDDEVDGGADLLLLAVPGRGAIAPAAAAIATLTGAEPVATLGWPTDVIGPAAGREAPRVDDDAWMRTVGRIRDVLRRTRQCAAEPFAVLDEVGDACLAALTGLLAQAAIRRTPVLLDGLVSGAAALLAEELAPGAAQWWLAGSRSPWPGHRTALARLRLEPIVNLEIARDDGVGALLALPALHAAIDLLTAEASRPATQ